MGQGKKRTKRTSSRGRAFWKTIETQVVLPTTGERIPIRISVPRDTLPDVRVNLVTRKELADLVLQFAEELLRFLLPPRPRGRLSEKFNFVKPLGWYVPLAHEVLKEEMKNPEEERDPRLRAILAKIPEIMGSPLDVPSHGRKLRAYRETLAYLIDRAFTGAWETFQSSRPLDPEEGFVNENFLTTYLDRKAKLTRQLHPLFRDFLKQQVRQTLFDEPGAAAILCGLVGERPSLPPITKAFFEFFPTLPSD